jgi:hypothetical protein
MFKLLTAGAMMLSALAVPAAISSPAYAKDPVPDVVTASFDKVNGTGCPQGSTAISVSEDKQAITVTYAKFQAKVGRGAAEDEFRRNCQISLKVDIPQGYTYSIVSANYRGFARLEPGASAYSKANYYFQGYTPDVDGEKKMLRGPYDGDWKLTDKLGMASVSLKCGQKRNLQINTELRAYAGPSDVAGRTTSLIGMDSTDTSFSTEYRLAWKRC